MEGEVSMEVQLPKGLGFKLKLSLLSIRLTVGIVFLVWAIDKLFNAEHTVAVFQAFYGMSISPILAIMLGGVQLLFVICFILGFWKNATYLIVLVMHSISTIVSFSKYLDPLNNLLFFAAWPMLAAALTLYLLRNYDSWVLPSPVLFKRKNKSVNVSE